MSQSSNERTKLNSKKSDSSKKDLLKSQKTTILWSVKIHTKVRGKMKQGKFSTIIWPSACLSRTMVKGSETTCSLWRASEELITMHRWQTERHWTWTCPGRTNTTRCSRAGSLWVRRSQTKSQKWPLKTLTFQMSMRTCQIWAPSQLSRLIKIVCYPSIRKIRGCRELICARALRVGWEAKDKGNLWTQSSPIEDLRQRLAPRPKHASLRRPLKRNLCMRWSSTI